FVIFFFFQAEDGIRDFHVTGVQTCALPIWPQMHSRPAARRRAYWSGYRACRRSRCRHLLRRNNSLSRGLLYRPDLTRPGRAAAQIGRASCRERGEMSGGGVSVEKKEEVRRR